ncbi:MAG TPA: porin [Candidatus Binatia bacterium]|nr:porin [Candidatus Binatia bacterium]
MEALTRKVQLLEKRLEQSQQSTLPKGQEQSVPNVGEDRVEAIDQKVHILERRWELEQEAAAAKAKEAPIFGAGKEGFFLRSADGNFQLRIRGYLQADGRVFADDQEHVGTDTFLLRRVRPIFEGTVFKNFDFRLMPDFGGGTTVIQDAYVDARFWPQAKLRVGKYKPPLGLERLQSGSELLFVERGLPTNLVPNRDIGAQLHGDLLDGSFTYALGAFNGVPDLGNGDGDTNDDKDFVGRAFVHPFKNTTIKPLQGLGIGFAGSYGKHSGTAASPNLPSYRTQGQLTFFKYRSDGTVAGTTVADGHETRYSPQGYYYWGPFGLLWEYVWTLQKVKRNTARATLDNDAWQVALSYVLTGENASYRSVSPARPFDLTKGTWGAFEIAARYGELHVDKDTFPVFANPAGAARVAESWGIGLNWYLNRNFKFQLNYEQTDFTGGGAQGERPKEHAVLSRFQISY